MDREGIKKLTEMSYRKGYNEGFFDASNEFLRLTKAAVESYKKTAEKNLLPINKYWEEKANETQE